MKLLLNLCLLTITVFAGHHKNDKKKSKDDAIQRGNFQITKTVKETNRHLLTTVKRAWKAKKVSLTQEEYSWVVNVPRDYDTKKPAGIFYYVSGSASGKIPKEWNKVLTEKNLIYVSSDKLPANSDLKEQHFVVLQGIENITKKYKINKKRIYLAGRGGGNIHVGGATVASSTGIMSSNIFKGVVYIDGGAFWENVPAISHGKKGYYWYSFFGENAKIKSVTGLSVAKKNAFVMINNNSNPYLKDIYTHYNKNYFRKLKHIDATGVPNMEILTITIDFLDNPK